MNDDELIKAMRGAFESIADSGMWTWDAALRAILAVVREHDKDGERYRWLRRRNELTEADSSDGPFVIDLLSDGATIHHMTGKELDAAIDAARGKE